MKNTDNPICVRCNKPVVKNKEYYETFEKMHWICFHFEFEHPTDPDQPCGDPGCPWNYIKIYEKKLNDLGINPQEVVIKSIEEQQDKKP
jgi:hypothetical protein